MKFEKIHNKGQAQLFQNKYLEYLTRSHPMVIWSIYLPIIIYLLFVAFSEHGLTASGITMSFVAGIFAWTLFEYLVHRYAFHFEPKTEKASKIVYLIHGNHHEYPRDKQRLFMPPVPSLLIATVLFAMQFYIAAAAGLQPYVFAFFPGFLMGYLLYGSMHYAIHAWHPPFKWMKPLWRNHHMHHYKQQERGFGVSSTLWDRVFGTMFDLKKEVDDAEQVQSLMFKRNPSKNLISEESSQH